MSHPILLLHGAIGSSAQLQPLAEELKKSGFDPRLFDFAGHGGREIPETPFSISLFADEVISWMDDYRIGEIDIFGYSMGGYVGLYLAKHYPERVGRIQTVATKLGWDVPTSQKEVRMLDPRKLAEKVPKFAEVLRQRHAPSDWETVLSKTAEMMLEMGENPPLTDEDFKTTACKIQLCVGDSDAMVSKEETTHVADLIPNSSLKILEQTPHPIEQMNVHLLKDLAVDFLTGH